MDLLESVMFIRMMDGQRENLRLAHIQNARKIRASTTARNAFE
ncbi:hypothetical protein [Achromobacter piechaudii]